MEKIKKLFKKKPFISTWTVLFAASFLPTNQETILRYIYILLILIPYFYFYIFTPFLFMRDKRKFADKLLSLKLSKLFIVIVFSIGLPSVGIVAYNGYKEAEIRADIKRTQKKYLPKIKSYKEFSNKEVKELSMKLYLLNACEGGQKRIEVYRNTDSNAKASACHELLRLNIKKENLPSSKTELEIIKYLNTINFGKALDEFKDFINE